MVSVRRMGLIHGDERSIGHQALSLFLKKNKKKKREKYYGVGFN
jgi:hypothetical protein